MRKRDNVDHTIHLFDPSIELEEIKARPVPPRHRSRRLPDESTQSARSGRVERVTIWRHVVDAKRNKIAATQLAVDRKVEECQIARPALQLQPGAD